MLNDRIILAERHDLFSKKADRVTADHLNDEHFIYDEK